MAPPQARRGRRPQPPAVPGGYQARVGWLLRINRLYGRDESASIAADFGRRFGGTGLQRPVGEPTISRWETGRRPVSHVVLRGYEDLLGLPAQILVAVADAARPVDDGPGPASRDAGTEQRTEDLLYQAVDGAVMAGGDWTDLTGGLLAAPRIVLFPRDTWSGLAERLLAEMVIAESTGWLQRIEALQRLLRHPHGRPAVIRAVGDLIRDGTNQVFVDPLTLLESVGHPEATGHLLRQIADPTNEHARRGAWCSAAEKIRRGHFSPAELNFLSRQATDLLTGEAPHPGCRVAAAELLRQTRGDVASKFTGVLRKAADDDAVTRHVLRRGRMAAAEAAATVIERLAGHAVSRLPREGLAEDPLLEVLLDEMLFHPQVSRRLLAAQFIEATPYRPLIAGALVAELGRCSASSPALACAILQALSTVGDPEARTLVQKLVLATGIPPEVTEAAAWSLGHLRGESPVAFWSTALARQLGNTPVGPSALSLSSARGLVYGLGVSRNTAMLRRLSSSAAGEPAVRTAAAWWLRTPRAVLDSTGR
ncbi:hypothetical protein [Paractinoplanes atraurantiacus]|uniref:HTH cro/C1-type domain-containing protein n=1 Tax=Paractinoplanes atraurantiacus TaxID=1036182 RepID=A0A285HX96_9ACTN|nr:hypothetical protein [Actinoplanes atraurantiacus]SNY40267.1 hypothetical protein SAMN05421748_10614 [Actinoplanes atraurantiacus]